MFPPFLIFFRFNGWFHAAEVRAADTLFEVSYWPVGLVGDPIRVRVTKVNDLWLQVEDTVMDSPEFIYTIGRTIEQTSM